MSDSKEKLLEQLTGVNSSKLNYYVELKKRNEEILQQNSRLEILHQLARDINIDMSVADIIERTFAKLPQTLPCDFLGLVTTRNGALSLKAMMPRDFCQIDDFPAHSPSLNVIRDKQAGIFNLDVEGLDHIRYNPKYSTPLKCLAVAPLLKRDEVFGSLIVGSSGEDAYREADLRFVQHLADQLSISIQNARLYKQVSRAKKEWEETFKAVTDPILLIDTDYNVLQHNDRLPEELREAWERAVVNKCYNRLKGRTKPCRDCPVHEVKRTHQPFFHRLQTPAGNLLDMSYYPVFNEDNQVVAITVLMKDVTQKTKIEGQLVHSAKLAAIGEMAAGVAHELNSPMTVIIGTAQLLLKPLPTNSEDGELLGDIVNCGLRCKRIIQNLLTFSRQDQAPVSDTDINSEVQRVLGLIRYQINRSQIRIVADLDPELPKMSANGPQIQQVLTNFLVNARDALKGVEREKIIKVRTSIIDRKGQRCAIISVTDNGSGIPPEHLPKIFTPFFTSKEASKGTGLGLSVSLGIAESHQGTIEVESTPGKGSTFSLLLPLNPGEGLQND
ncbi:ATP-binding protein [Trichloromonas sp.]|uniref:GAF domain-containing sensor histidine kinase n=1 Tax=Trichloromonas sp. TaxID=3069249 RepID=UPI003D817081